MYREFSSGCILPRCLSCPTVTDVAAGEIICESCGRVFADRIECKEELHSGGAETSTARTETITPLMMYDMGLQSTISVTPKDAKGNTISNNTRKNFDRLRLLNGRCLGPNTQSLRIALVGLQALSTKLAIPSAVKERAAYICRKALENKLALGRSIDNVMCASLYVACREARLSRTIDELAKLSNTPKKNVLRTYKALLDSLEMHPEIHNLSEFVNRLGNQIMITEQTKRSAFAMLSEITKKAMVGGRNPMALAAAILYYACTVNDEEKSQRYIAKEASVSTSTIRSTISVLRSNFVGR